MLRNFKPPDGDADKIKFYTQMNAGRIVIQNAFSLFTSRWHIMKSARIFARKLPEIVFVCCYLYNFWRLMGEASSRGRSNVNVNPNVTMLE